MLQLQLKQNHFLPVLKFHAAYPFKKLMPLAMAFPPPPSNSLRLSFKSSAKAEPPLLICRINRNSGDMISQLELGKPENKRKPEKRVNGIFWILLINLGIFVADHIFQVPWIKGLYLYHNQPTWYQFITSTFCHFNWNHLSSNLFFLYIFGETLCICFSIDFADIDSQTAGFKFSWLILPRNAVSIGASGAVFGLFAVSVLVKMSWDWRKILEVLILGQFVVEKVILHLILNCFGFALALALAVALCNFLICCSSRPFVTVNVLIVRNLVGFLTRLAYQVMEAAQASASLGGTLRGGYALQNVNHIAHLSGALIGVVLIWLLSSVPSPTDNKYEGLDRIIRLRLKLQPNSFRFVATKVAADGIIFGPLDLLVFFTYMGFSSGKTAVQVKEDVKRDFLPALILEGGVWPIVQVANFRFVPVRYQLLYVNFFCLLDSCFLSWIEQQEDAPWKQMFKSFQPLKEQ
ncbi:hypothetical protein RD792_008519 [Penstemon davidsonii]|uniref:Peptidase S54 rhomboid domain-containing protein n=1 Tax=Penstemon davidsonii TaxID=160366 RepID=A0ABR0D9D3_9LAMI|nr:hypothetical protein RD792_008519 [Penstemon davidsonii]